jgi:hypothetical protein
MGKIIPAFVCVCVLAHMPSPRGRAFFKELAERIRSERTLQQQEREERAAEVRALQGRLWRLEHWAEICQQIERLRTWETACELTLSR